jgi:hypothetical protein
MVVGDGAMNEEILVVLVRVDTSLSTNSGHNGRNFCNFGVSAFVQVTKQTE